MKNIPLTEKLKAFVQLSRAGNCVMAGVAVLIGYWLSAGGDAYLAALAMLSGALVCAGGQAINDYFDSNIDSRKNKEKPIPSGRVTKNEALCFTIICFGLGALAARQVNPGTLWIALTFTVLLIAYPVLMNRVKYIGNIVVALGTSITFIYGALAADALPPLVLMLAASAFFSNMGREVTKDIEDVRKDKGAKKTLPMLVGRKTAIAFVSFHYAIAVMLSIAAFFLFSLSYAYLLLIVAAEMLLTRAFYQLRANAPTKSQKTSKQAMLVSLAAFVLSGLR